MQNKFVIKVASCILLAIGLLAAACTNEDIVVSVENEKDIEFDNSGSKLSFQDIQTLVGAFRPHTRAANTEEYVFITDDEDGDTLFFVVNYPEGGWKMYASDKRVPAVVAECENGRFDLSETEEMMGTWFDAMKEDMKAVRQAQDYELNFTAEEIEENVNRWDAVCDIQRFLQEHDYEYIGPGRIPSGPGYFVLYNTETDTIFYDSINHLTTTKWDQGTPYNNYCPNKHGESGKAPAGCVAIAGAQMLFYLHNKLGVPATTVNSASCTGDITNYVMNQWGNSSTVWNAMENDSTYSAPLIAYVGKGVNMQYGNNSSSAFTVDLVNNVFVPNGISCQYDSLDIQKLSTSLLAGMPVVARAVRKQNGHNYGHSFIIDGYKRMRSRTTYYYYWVSEMELPIPENGSLPPLLILWKNKAEHYYDTPYIDKIKMNWGWGDYYYQNAPWVAPTGDWVVNNRNYLYERCMIYNFAVL